uniref:Carrier superfamily protein n=2 Tax=Hirondellea gigas TaxID=1518452 RepID=A0A6A7G479_9CRUS
MADKEEPKPRHKPAYRELELEVLRKIFDDIDTNHNNAIDRDELVMALTKLKLGHDRDEVMELFDQFTDSAEINFDEFVTFVSSREKEIQQVFQEIDLDGNGFLERSEICTALDRIGMHYTNENLKTLFHRMDDNGDLAVSYDEFRSFVMLLPSINIRAIWNSHAVHNGIDIGEDLTVPDEIIQRPEAWQLLIAGGTAGAISRTMTAPADRLKVMYQAGINPSVSSTKGVTPSTSSSASVPSMRSVIKQIYREGGWRAFYRGNGTNTLKIGPESAAKFFAYERIKRLVCSDPDHPVVLERLVSGAGAGVVSQTSIYPLEVVKTRLALAKSGESKGILNCLITISRTEGFPALFRGLGASLAGIIPYAGVDLAVYNTLRDTYSEWYPKSRPSALLILTSGAFSSVCGQVIAFPFQCIRTKLQAQGMPGRPVRYSGMFDCFRQTVSENGIRGLYRGILPNFMKAVPAVSISYLVYERVKDALARK